MAFTYAFVAVAILGVQLVVFASPNSFVNLQTQFNSQSQNKYGETGDSINFLKKRRHVPVKSNQAHGPSTKDLEASISFAKDVVSRMARLEMNLAAADVQVKLGTPTHGQLIDSYPRPRALLLGKDALITVKASVHLAHSQCRRFGFNEERCGKYVSTLNLNTTSFGQKCPSATYGSNIQYCSNSTKYRTLDGSCNHQTYPNYGTAFTGYRRLVSPDYGDAIQLPRENFKGKALPSARLISTRLSKDGNKLEPDKTLALMQWTQFVDHDMSHTPVSKMSNTGSSIICCKHDGSILKPRHVHPSCFPIEIPSGDPFYGRQHVHCMNYVRSVPAIRTDCTFAPLEQMNQASHFLDGSMIYGTSNEKAQTLRQFFQGKLIDSTKDGRRFLPSVEKPTEECLVNSDATACYRSGDVRVNSHPHLTVMYTLWHREHNRVADKLAQLNPQWDDETVYQEARRIVIAEIQHITFNEWLPVVLGEKFSKKQGLKLPNNGYTNSFDDSVDPSVTNSFSTAALRFVNSMMESKLRLYDEGRQRRSFNDTILLKEHFNRPAIVEQAGQFDALIRGLATQNSRKTDMDYIEDITSSLYADSYPYGLDVISLDIQRGRDHGLPGYNKYRQFCGLPAATNFEQFHDVIPKSIVAKLQAIYSHPDDVDLLIGGMSEHPAADGLLGHTFRCILAEQFVTTMKGDRYFYDLQNQAHSFEREQLRSLKKVTLARIFCDNGDGIESMQPHVFTKPTASNELVLCRREDATIPRLNLDLWKTTQTAST